MFETFSTLTSLPAVIIPKLSPSENITDDIQSRPSRTAILLTVSVSASSISNSHFFLGAHLKYKELCTSEKIEKLITYYGIENFAERHCSKN